jgi:hypothetical protein
LAESGSGPDHAFTVLIKNGRFCIGKNVKIIFGFKDCHIQYRYVPGTVWNVSSFMTCMKDFLWSSSSLIHRIHVSFWGSFGFPGSKSTYRYLRSSDTYGFGSATFDNEFCVILS